MQAEEQPQNGIAGLKHWRNDPGAGLQVALVSLPLSLGIAVASSAPPITGKMTSSEGRPAAHCKRQRIRLGYLA
jgi:MFS superfamily sulfate permease-like transporter